MRKRGCQWFATGYVVYISAVMDNQYHMHCTWRWLVAKSIMATMYKLASLILGDLDVLTRLDKTTRPHLEFTASVYTVHVHACSTCVVHANEKLHDIVHVSTCICRHHPTGSTKLTKAQNVPGRQSHLTTA